MDVSDGAVAAAWWDGENEGDQSHLARSGASSWGGTEKPGKRSHRQLCFQPVRSLEEGRHSGCRLSLGVELERWQPYLD